ncbi:DM13 domain-containing protein [Flavobacterium sp.]|uniref:DM13 domain-containing protein n=1 Tax=Flavobacterium sp. TaxID=239 RepID=UPI0026311B8D|nr:DM13 domain-containing protein [Flavobacterium sp.]
MRTLVLIVCSFLLFGCSEEGVLTSGRVAEEIAPDATLQYAGNFAPTSGITVSGGAQIYFSEGTYKLQLTDFSISNGPDLKVYLSQAAVPSNFVNLGNLSAQTVYEIPNSVVVSDYDYVLIHCQQYNHLFAVTALTQN